MASMTVVVVELGPSETPAKQGEVMLALGLADFTTVLRFNNSKKGRLSNSVSMPTFVRGVFTTA